MMVIQMMTLMDKKMVIEMMICAIETSFPCFPAKDLISIYIVDPSKSLSERIIASSV